MTSDHAGGDAFAPAPLYWLALGTFAIGTESFMIAPLLPSISADLAISVPEAGTLVSVFALTYALSSPLLTIITGRLNRKHVLVMAMVAFALGNVIAWSSRGFWGVMGARIALALAAGLYTPNASALAGTLAPPEQRGRSLAIVNGGLTVAIVLGLPIGSVIGMAYGWRTTFLAVGALAAVAAAGLILGLPPQTAAGMPVAGLRRRVSVIKLPHVLAGVVVTLLWASGTYTVWTYVASFVSTVLGLGRTGISGVVLLWGVAAAIGISAGGHFHDRLGASRTIVPALGLLIAAFTTLFLSARLLGPDNAFLPVLAAVAAWGFGAWAFFPAQIARLVDLAEPSLAPVILSLNASFMFVGFSLGAYAGGFILHSGHVRLLSLVGMGFEMIALMVYLSSTSE